MKSRQDERLSQALSRVRHHIVSGTPADALASMCSKNKEHRYCLQQHIRFSVTWCQCVGANRTLALCCCSAVMW